jgi:lipopolysaccharide assembly outer membrane protein LptD (OstA)
VERIARGSAVGIAFILALAVIMAKGICWAAQPSEVFLEAETVAYNEKGSLATAEGNALLRYGAIRIYADSIDFDIASQEALAKALPGKSVSIISGTQKLYGESLFYHLPTEEGVLEGAKGEMRQVWGNCLCGGKSWSSPLQKRLLKKVGSAASQPAE